MANNELGRPCDAPHESAARSLGDMIPRWRLSNYRASVSTLPLCGWWQTARSSRSGPGRRCLGSPCRLLRSSSGRWQHCAFWLPRLRGEFPCAAGWLPLQPCSLEQPSDGSLRASVPCSMFGADRIATWRKHARRWPILHHLRSAGPAGSKSTIQLLPPFGLRSSGLQRMAMSTASSTTPGVR